MKYHITVLGMAFLLLLATVAVAGEPPGKPDANKPDTNKSDTNKPDTNADPTGQEYKPSHDGGLHDIDAIGNRNVGCDKGLGNWYSLEKQVALGKSFAQQVEASSKLINDPVITEYVNRVGQNIVRNSDAKVPFTIKVIDSDDVNAFALPGGFFYVNSGLILAADNEAELAGVMAHETGHVAACHAARGATRGNLMQLASIPLIFIGGGLGYGVQEAASIALPMTYFKFSRGFESQADFLGLEYMYKAGYDPESFIAFFEKVQAREKKKPGFIAKTFETHPMTPDRVAKSQEEIATVLPPRDQYIVNTSEFDDVKGRLARIESGRKLRDAQDKDRPSLRRTGSPSSKDKDKKGTSDDDDRPTLQRRDDGSGPGK